MAAVTRIRPLDVPKIVDPLPDFLPDPARPGSYTTTLAFVPNPAVADPIFETTDLVPGANNLLTRVAALTRGVVVFPGSTIAIAGAVKADLFLAYPIETVTATKAYPATPSQQAFQLVTTVRAATGPASTRMELVIPQSSIRTGIFYAYIRYSRTNGVNPLYSKVISGYVDLIGPPDGGETPGQALLVGDPAKNTITLADLTANPAGLPLTIPDFVYKAPGDTVRVYFGDANTDTFYNDTLDIPLTATSPFIALIPNAFITSRGAGNFIIRYEILDASGNKGFISQARRVASEPGGPLVLAAPVVVDAAPGDDLITYADATKPQGTAIDIPFNPGLVPFGHQIALYVNGVRITPNFPYPGGDPARLYIPIAQMVALYGTANTNIPMVVTYTATSGGIESPPSPPTSTFMNLYLPGPEITPPGSNTNANLPAPHVQGSGPTADVLIRADADSGADVNVTIVTWADSIPPVNPRPDFFYDLYLEGQAAPFVSGPHSATTAGTPIIFPVPYSFFGVAGSVAPVRMYYEVREAGKPNTNPSPRTPVTIPTPVRNVGLLRMLNLVDSNFMDCTALRPVGGTHVFYGQIDPSIFLVEGATVTINYMVSLLADKVGGSPEQTTETAPTPIPPDGVLFKIPYDKVRALDSGFLTVSYTVTFAGEVIDSPEFQVEYEVAYPGFTCTV